jgi:exodeoxyribonuclease V alpha subunit
MIRAFGEKVFEVIEAEPDRLREVTGIGGSSEKDHGRLGRAEGRSEILVFLHGNGVRTIRAVRIFKTYGADAVQIMPRTLIGLLARFEGLGSRARGAP